MTRVDVFIPVYNEERALPQTMPQLHGFLSGPDFPYDWKIVITDNASIDDTPAVSRKLAEEYPGQIDYVRIERKGRGYALKQVWPASDADIVSYMDVDLSTGIEAFPKLLKAIAEDGYDVATGSRLMRKSRVTRSLKRRVLTFGYNAMIKGMFWTRFSDAQCGFKAVSQEVARKVVPMIENDNWFWDTELLILAEKMGYRIKDVPVRWIEDTDTRVKIGGTIMEDVKGLIRMRRTQPWRKSS
ncbi:MAG TPA: dolichyl-phosphate beta-glucosyltransferase [Dehalococcoidia bacterium]|nr:dolichyl-phosphate beta-glucosyltransferase [Dehalococcoidia bacterium]